jgi:calcium/calmodulin-dependent 3',5'-cyclic nucleotide phosphodiesterase
MSDDKFKEFRIMLIHNILHTDMKEHFNMIKLLETRMKEDKKSFDSEEDQKLLTGMLIHASDFNGGVRIFPISRNWSELVNKEFIA